MSSFKPQLIPAVLGMPFIEGQHFLFKDRRGNYRLLVDTITFIYKSSATFDRGADGPMGTPPLEKRDA